MAGLGCESRPCETRARTTTVRGGSRVVVGGPSRLLALPVSTGGWVVNETPGLSGRGFRSAVDRLPRVDGWDPMGAAIEVIGPLLWSSRSMRQGQGKGEGSECSSASAWARKDCRLWKVVSFWGDRPAWLPFRVSSPIISVVPYLCPSASRVAADARPRLLGSVTGLTGNMTAAFSWRTTTCVSSDSAAFGTSLARRLGPNASNNNGR